jgi:hypothetical protein
VLFKAVIQILIFNLASIQKNHQIFKDFSFCNPGGENFIALTSASLKRLTVIQADDQLCSFPFDKTYYIKRI